jgi:hypothetical protein
VKDYLDILAFTCFEKTLRITFLIKRREIMIFEKEIMVPVWNEKYIQRSVDFWSRRGFVFEKVSEKSLFGKRGSLLGNLFAMRMEKLRTKLYISILQESEIHCLLDIDTTGQFITETNKEHWKMELNTYETFLLRNDEQTEKWVEYRKRSRLAAWIWTLTMGLFTGDKPSRKE